MGRKRYAVRYFIVWPPPHPGYERRRRDDRAMWYWNDRVHSWGDKLHGTGYPSRAAAEQEALVAASAVTQRSPNVDALGKVRTSRQLVALVQVDMSEV